MTFSKQPNSVNRSAQGEPRMDARFTPSADTSDHPDQIPMIIADDQYSRRLFVHSIYTGEMLPAVQSRRIGDIFAWAYANGYKEVSIAGLGLKLTLSPYDRAEEIEKWQN